MNLRGVQKNSLLLGKRLREIRTWGSRERRRFFSKVVKHKLMIHEKGSGSSDKR
jgi:hypothetical protein